MFSIFAFSSFKRATNDWVISLLESDGEVVQLKYEEPGSATMLMCSSVRVLCGTSCRRRELVAKFDPCDHQRMVPHASVVKLVTILLEFLTSFPAFFERLLQIGRSRHETRAVRRRRRKFVGAAAADFC